MLVQHLFNLTPDDIFFIEWRWPQGNEWFYVLLMGLAALFGQYFVTKAYGADKAGIVSVFGYANIIFSVFIGMALGDAFPDLMSLSWYCLYYSQRDYYLARKESTKVNRKIRP